MRLKLVRRGNDAPEFNMLALLDIIFLVLIFCIIAMAKLVFLEIVEVENPELRSAKSVESKDFVSITVTEDGELYLNKEIVHSTENLIERLRSKSKSNDDLTVIINGDDGVTLGKALLILEAVREADFKNVYFKAKKKKAM